ncbi:MAG: tetratricopeptide repeat protein, partial [Verrucomicrobiota bacterium]
MSPCFQQLLAGFAAIAMCATAFGQSPDYEKLFDDHYLPQISEVLKRGEYRTTELACDEALRRGQQNPKWQTMRLTAIREQGRMKDVAKELPTLVDRHSEDLEFLVSAHDLYKSMGLHEQAAEALTNFNDAALKKPLKDRTAGELVAMGKAAYALGADPNKVLDEFYAAAKKKDPKLIDSYLAAGELALEKYDYARASKEFRAGLKQASQDPDLRFGLARSFFPSDRDEAISNAERVLTYNARHVGAKLMKVEHLLNSERYEEAQPLLSSILLINPNEPRALAFRSVIATLHENDSAAADEAREKALSQNAKNAIVPHLIGRCLSRRYRFEDGAELQRQALEWDPNFTAAKMQLASDAMRLGDEETAWKLAKEVSEADPYNVLAFNYTQLQKQLEDYGEIETPEFLVRMREDEIGIYGDRALEILEEASEVLCEKYHLELEEQTLVEFFAEQQDFAIRTFGELGGAGYLGVCFGTVITMNSPGSSASGFSNWEATLWHEFCHVVTLTATKNRMPRWLSEGISVYEEEQRDPTWGQRMTPEYRSRILEDEKVTPVGALSSVFINAETPEDVMFAYYQSALVVEFMLGEYGQDAFNALLKELATGTPINPAIEKHTEALEPLEEKFLAFIRKRAEDYGPGVDWARPDQSDGTVLGDLATSVQAEGKNFWAKQRAAMQALAEENWTEAASKAQDLIELFPAYVEQNNGYLL